MLHKACALCGQPPVAAINLGPLLGPIREVRGGGTEELYVHRLCAVWSAEVRCCSAGAGVALACGPPTPPAAAVSGPLAVHGLCLMLAPSSWPQVVETDHGTLRCVLAAIKRGRQLKCTHCGHRGATLGCRVPACACK